MTEILLVEDDHDIAENLQLFVQKQNWQWHWLDTGEKVVETVKQNQPDIILLDLMLPVVNGIDCCKQIRMFSDVPIIMMTARVEEVDRLIGLEAGADDYVCKPFSAAEMILRVKAILKRTQTQNVVRALDLIAERNSIVYKGINLQLTTLEFKLFKVLHKSPYRIYSRQQIIELAYPDIIDIVDRTVDSHIRNLRSKIKRSFGIKGTIESIYGAGYRYIEPE